jgi:tetratricopeptide (TPR) repeat protein
MAEPDILTQAIEAARRGERRRARQLLTKLLRADQKNEQAWLWMSAVVESDRERIFCLQSVLKINPENKPAHTGLRLLGALPAMERPHSILEDYEREPGEQQRPGGRRLNFLRRRRAYEWTAITGLSVAILCCLGLAWAANFGAGQLAAFNVARTTEAYQSPTASQAPSITPSLVPSATPLIRSATPTLDPATPLAYVVGATVSPTIVYFETPHPENDAYQAGLRRYYTGDWAELMRFMDSALDANPNLWEAHFYIGEALRQTGRPADAVEAYDESIALNERFAPAYWGRGLAQAELGRISAALEDLRQASEHDPRWTAPYLERAGLNRSQGDLEQARADLVSAEAVAADDAAVHWQLAQILADQSEIDAAMDEVEAAARLDPAVVEIYLVRGRLKLLRGDLHGARADLGLYLTYQPNDAEAWYYRAQASVALADETNALADFERALALSPTYVDALTARAEYLLGLERFEAAEADFGRALGQADTARIRLGRGQVYYHQGNLDQAIVDFRRAVNRDPDSYPANFWLGRTLVEADLPADAVAPLTHALELATTDDERFAAYLFRAGTYRLLGRLEEEAGDLGALLVLKVDASAEQSAARQRLDAVETDMTATVVAASASPTFTLTVTAQATATRTPRATATRTPRPSASLTPNA